MAAVRSEERPSVVCRRLRSDKGGGSHERGPKEGDNKVQGRDYNGTVTREENEGIKFYR